MKIFSSGDTELWERQGAEVAKTVSDSTIDLIVLDSTDKETDSFFTKEFFLKEDNSDVLRDLKDLLLLRYAIKARKPIFALGSRSLLAFSAIGHNTVRNYQVVTQKRVQLVFDKTNRVVPSLPGLSRLASEFEDGIEVPMTSTGWLSNSASSGFYAVNLLKDSVSYRLHAAFVPSFRLCCFQPDPKLFEKDSEQERFFFELVNIVLKKSGES